MRVALKRHPETPCDAVTRVEVDVARLRPGNLSLHYCVAGRIGDLRIPAATISERVDGLWQHTCFEAFIRTAQGGDYFELNFSPSTRWAAYLFRGYRKDMSVAGDFEPPRFEVRSRDSCYELLVSLELNGLSNLPSSAAYQFGLAAVIEETSGHKSYWALAHPPGRPDFHHDDCFALALSAEKP
jgi:hypothetical protein